MSPVPKAWQEIMTQETAGGIPTGPAQSKKKLCVVQLSRTRGEPS